LVDFVSFWVNNHPKVNDLEEADFHTEVTIFNLSLVQTHGSLG
jgi:hypothetical protein